MQYYRHGDLSFHPITEVPEGLTPIKHEGSFVLAEGEFTGHKHLLTVPKIENLNILQDKQGNYYIDLRDTGTLSHEEHKTLTLDPGIYKMNVEREYDYFAKETEHVRQVMD